MEKRTRTNERCAYLYHRLITGYLYLGSRSATRSINLGRDKLKMSCPKAAYFASVFTSLLEGLTQFNLIEFGKLALMRGQWKNF